jgi:hypothetical protein
MLFSFPDDDDELLRTELLDYERLRKIASDILDKKSIMQEN